MKIKRFTILQRIFHLLLMISFLIQAATGVGRMYIETSFGQTLVAPFGGFYGALSVHKWVGIFMIALFVVHLIYLFVLLLRPGRGSIRGADSIIPGLRDFKPVFQHIGWMFGIKKHPRFERWGYWEKFDYWAVFWGMIILGGTGLILYNPLTSSGIMPGWALNVAFWVHRIEAILAIGHVFIIHFAIAHLRKLHFPMDKAIFTGRAGLEANRLEKPAWIERLDKEGRLEKLTVSEASIPARVVAYVVGYSAILTGLYILVGGILYVRYISW